MEYNIWLRSLIQREKTDYLTNDAGINSYPVKRKRRHTPVSHY